MDFRDINGKIVDLPPDQPYEFRPAVYGFCENEGKVLCIKPNWDDKLCLPGGSLDKGEDIIEGLKREFLEETGYEIDVHDPPLHVDTSKFANPARDMYFQRISIYFHVSIKDTEQKSELDSETEQLLWKEDPKPEEFTQFQQDFFRKILGD
ncbi:NUDIX hydrolase [Candidatus Woesearchaeota archaeon]|nr:NUDIX hydrolase [Candidatus Woesearchaeota archaeon]